MTVVSVRLTVGLSLSCYVAGCTRIGFFFAFSPDGQHIVSGSSDKLVKVWSMSARKEVASPAGHTSIVYHSGSPGGPEVSPGPK
jgi:WD40 repeat protein